MSADFIAGCLGGCAGVLVGHPLDTIKVHLQTQDPKNPIYKGVWHCMNVIVQAEGVKGLYKGMTSPLLGIALINSTVFGVYGNVQRHMKEPEALISHTVAGGFAGMVQSIVCAPMELAKTRMQLQHGVMKFKGPLDCLKHIYTTEGIRGANKGLIITVLRDIPGFASYFASYEYLMRLKTKPGSIYTMFCGGMAGTCSWLACYPFDVIKTILQADGMTGPPKYKGIMDCAQRGYRADGLHFYMRGLSSTLVRSFPMNAACFMVYELIMGQSSHIRFTEK